MGLVRLYFRAWAWYGRRSDWVKLLVPPVVVTSPCWAWAGFVYGHRYYEHWFIYTADDREYVRAQARVHPDGLPSAARRLKAEMEAVPDPDAAKRLHPEWAAVRLPNGEWLFGHGLDSHRQFTAGRGTLVVKDSRGRVRCFFGHVCGSGGAELAFRQFEHVRTLDEFYRRMQEDDRFREWVPPP